MFSVDDPYQPVAEANFEASPQIGNLIYFNDKSRPDLTEIVVCYVNEEAQEIMFCNRHLNKSLFNVDMHLGIVICKRCKTVSDLIIAVRRQDGGVFIDFPLTADSVKNISQHHIDCSTPICLN